MSNKCAAWVGVTMIAVGLLANTPSEARAKRPRVNCREEIWPKDPKIHELVREDMRDGKPRSGLKPPAKTTHVLPEYPKEAVKQGLVGRLVVMGRIDSRTGQPTDLTVDGGPEMLAAAALKAARKWRYRPLEIDGVKYDLELHAEITFTLE
ncbi:MAG: hypothetical protein DMF80_12635 [Acidobacteria bacterium]|nr:MAG: hypothetical protein DMF80_12635 [Acidobacteriota bacterium]